MILRRTVSALQVIHEVPGGSRTPVCPPDQCTYRQYEPTHSPMSQGDCSAGLAGDSVVVSLRFRPSTSANRRKADHFAGVCNFPLDHIPILPAYYSLIWVHCDTIRLYMYNLHCPFGLCWLPHYCSKDHLTIPDHDKPRQGLLPAARGAAACWWAAALTVFAGSQAAAWQLEEGHAELQHEDVWVVVLMHHQDALHGAAHALLLIAAHAQPQGKHGQRTCAHALLPRTCTAACAARL